MRSLFIMFIPVLVLATAFTAGAQQPFAETIHIDRQKDGININVLHQLPDSYLLIGTNAGLYNYDGYHARPVPSTDSLAIDVRSIYTDSRGTTWLGYRNGKIMQMAVDSIRNFVSEEGHPAVSVTAITETPDSLIWFGTYGEGIYYWNGERQFNINTDDGIPDNYIYDLVSDRYGNCWAGTDRGIVRCSIINNEKVIKTYGTAEGLSDLIVMSLCLDQSGKVWFGTYEKGIGFIDPESGKISMPANISDWPFGAVESLISYGGMLWAGTKHSGIIEYDPHSGTSRNLSKYPDLGPSTRINELYADGQMNIWVASYGKLIRTGGMAYSFISTEESGQSPTALLVDNNNNIFSAYGQELYKRNKAGREYGQPEKVILTSSINSIISLYEDKDGMIWIGTFGDGVLIYDPVKQKEMLINESSGLVNGNILSIDGSADAVWLATLQGATKVRFEGDGNIFEGSFTLSHFGEKEGLANNFIYKVFPDSRERVWFGTDGNGLFFFEHDSIYSYQALPELSDLVVYSITEDRSNNIWFSTARHGIYRAGDKPLHYGRGQGIQMEDIRGIMADASGNLIITYDEGVDILNIATDHRLNISSEIAGNIEGLSLNALFTRDNEAWLGARGKILKLNTALMPDKPVPPTIISKLRLFNKSIPMRDGLRLKHNENYLSFDYAGIWFMDPEQIRYQIKMEGNDIGWINTTNRTAAYGNLAPGSYTFMVRASADANFEHTRTARFSFIIAKPFTSTIWFYMIIISGLAGLLILIIKIRERNLRHIKDLEKEKILFEFETLKSQINPHFLFNSFSTLASIIEDNKMMAVEYVQQLSDFFRKILENRDRDLIPLEEELMMISKYIDIQKKRFGKSLILETNIPPEVNQSLVPPLVIQLLIENAIKHNIISLQRPLTIKIGYANSRLIIRNNLQPKQDAAASTGLGLENIRRRYSLLARKKIIVHMDKKEFIVELPLIN